MDIFLCRDGAKLPEFATQGSACFDLSACFSVDDKIVAHNPRNKKLLLPVREVGGQGLAVQIHPMHRVLIPTGLIFDIPENYVLKIFARSSMPWKHGLGLANGTAIIDSDYTEETFMMIMNYSDLIINVYNGDRLAQGRFEKNPGYTLEETLARPQQKTDRDGGLGSTGT